MIRRTLTALGRACLRALADAIIERERSPAFTAQQKGDVG